MAQKWMRAADIKARIEDPREMHPFRAWLDRQIATGRFPAPVRFSERLLFWRREDVEAWMQKRGITSEPAA